MNDNAEIERTSALPSDPEAEVRANSGAGAQLSEGASPGFLTGLLLGGLVGVTIAMVVAPQAGDQTRDVVRAKAREASESVRDAADDLSKSAQAAARSVSVSANELLVRGQHIVEEARARFDAAVAEGKKAAAQQRSTLENEA
jgi:gas vesicle protein